jgi:hypothetical protein
MGSSMFVDVSVGDLLWGYEAMLPCYFLLDSAIHKFTYIYCKFAEFRQKFTHKFIRVLSISIKGKG